MTDNNFNFTLIDTRGLEKPGVLLIEKISNACGMIYADLGRGGKFLHERIRSESNEQSALNNPDASDFSKQALAWDTANKVREYKNIGKILSQAAIQLPPKASEEKIHRMDDDWIAYVMKQAAMVSNAAMQDVWAKIISSEAENPGKFTRQAVNIISVMNEKDAKMFEKIGQFVTDDTPFDKGKLLIYDVLNDGYASQGINYVSLLHLQSLGLIDVWENSHLMSLPKPGALFRYGISYMRVSLQFDPKVEKYILGVGKASLTSAGREILSLAEPIRNPEFWEYVIEVWKGVNASPTPVSESFVNDMKKAFDAQSACERASSAQNSNKK